MRCATSRVLSAAGRPAPMSRNGRTPRSPATCVTAFCSKRWFSIAAVHTDGKISAIWLTAKVSFPPSE